MFNAQKTFDSQDPSHLVELLHQKAYIHPDRAAYTFLKDQETLEAVLTYHELDLRARTIAAHLQSLGLPGERAVLLYPPGLDFLTAFFGCLYAGVIAVPAYPPRQNRSLDRILAITNDCQARAALTISPILENITRQFADYPSLHAMRWIATETLNHSAAQEWEYPAITGDTLAFLQYTSGSTSAPKGVMVTHNSLLWTLEDLDRPWEHTPQSVMVSWLPTFHDMGLIYGTLMPIYKSFACYLMAPVTFLQQPLCWLQAISIYRGTHSAAPNFAFDLCVEKTTPEQRASLDLHSWRNVLNAAEPVRKETMQSFTEAFAPAGFRAEAFSPGFGLAEASLKVTAAHISAAPRLCTLRADELMQHRIREASPEDADKQDIVGCGWTHIDARIVIVDPDSRRQCPPDLVGEIWVASPAIAKGYWNRPIETADTFQAYLADTGEGPFLRTGDLGFIRDQELFITGRVKDLIIIRGLNYYPQDIEFTVENCHPALRPSCGAAFSVEIAGEERLVITQEVRRTHIRKLDVEEVVGAIRQAVAEAYELQVYAVSLLRTNSIYKTSSGKIQRRACRAAFLEGTLTEVAAWRQQLVEIPAAPSSLATQAHSAAEIRQWLIQMVARLAKIAPQQIRTEVPFARYGFDSVSAAQLAGELHQWLKQPCPPTLVYDYPNIDALTRFLSGAELVPFFSVKPSAPAQNQDEGIAVIGIGCRFPGAENPEAFWELLKNGVDAISEVPRSRWDAAALFDPQPATPGKMNTRWGGFLKDVDRFDPDFFSIAPREAVSMDPQQRLLLEVSWEALEHAGIVPESLSGSRTGVFIGISGDDYARLQLRHADGATMYAGPGGALSIAANRLSYTFNLHGPSWAVDTACSSSLVAVHQACQSLRQGECHLALAGGVNLILSPEYTIAFSQLRLMASDGRCKTFDARADGYVRGEGCGLVVLKRLSDALRDGNPILAVIRGSAVNQDGRSNGLTAPNGLAQEDVITHALRSAGVTGAQISYVEAHGTGTILGDPIEANTLKNVLLPGRSQQQPCWIGSVKTNIGHLESAAGIAGLIKVILALRHREIPPHLHLQQLNPHISFDGTPLTIPVKPQPWESGGTRRLAGVSSFGFGGTNAHVVLEEAPPQAFDEQPTANSGLPERPAHILALSAKTREALVQSAERYLDYLKMHPDVELADLCFSANTRRTHFPCRLSVSAESRNLFHEQLAAAASRLKNGETIQPSCEDGKVPPVVMLFTGQGAQYPGMGRELYETAPVFRKVIEQCDEILRTCTEMPPLRTLLYSEDSKQAQAINQTGYAQPALFALEYALAEVWKSWGVEPDAVLGHSLGEYAAACVAGVLSLEDGLKLVTERGRLMQALPQEGAMAAVMADESQVHAIIAPYPRDVSLAAVNGPQSCVISGRREAIQSILEELQGAGVKSKMLSVSHAFHSPLIEPMLEDFQRAVDNVSFCPPRIPLVSNLTGKIAKEQLLQTEYWRRHAREPVQFAAGLKTLLQQQYTLFLEIGPAPVLSGMARSIADSSQWLPSLRQGRSDWAQMLSSLGELYVSGAPVDWVGFDRAYRRRCVPAPTYPFQRQRYWLPETISPPTEQGIASDRLLKTLSNQLRLPETRLAPQSLQRHEPRREPQTFLQQFEATPPHQRQEFLFKHLGSQVAEVLGIASAFEIEPQRGFFDMGMDSLTSMDLQNRLQSLLECSLPMTITLKYPTLESLGNYVMSVILSRDVPSDLSQQNQKPSKAVRDTFLDDVKHLSEQELEAIIAQELGGVT